MTEALKFLDAYGPADKDVFFGRDREIAQLYGLLLLNSLVLVYGASGTGKTSLIQCGLAKRIPDTNWLPIYVRRRGDINASLLAAVNAALRAEAERHDAPAPGDLPLEAALDALYLRTLKPAHLIFDQVEELFLLAAADTAGAADADGASAEQDRFAETLARLVSPDPQRSAFGCKVILSLTEEHIAALQPLERRVPNLFAARLRVEPMTEVGLEAVVREILGTLNIAVAKDDPALRPMVRALSGQASGQLAYLQVYLARLASEIGDGGRSLAEAAQRIGGLGDVLGVFLQERSAAIQRDLGAKDPGLPADAVRRVLEAHATLEGTKRPLSFAALAAETPSLTDPQRRAILAQLQANRLIRDDHGLTELAHDALALKIAESRSTEERRRRELEKLVRDSWSEHQRTGDLMSPRQVALVWPDRAALNITPEQLAYVRRSRRAQAWSRGLRTGVAAVVAVLLIGAGAAYRFISTTPDIGFERAMSLAQAEKWDAAIKAISDTIDANPTDTELLLDRARIYHLAGRDPQASAEFSRYRRLDPASSELRNKLCLYETDVGLLADAEPDCKEAFRRSDVLDTYALLLYRQKRYREAAAEYLEADKDTQRTGCSLAVTLYGLSKTYDKLDDRSKSQAYAAQAHRLAGDVEDYFPFPSPTCAPKSKPSWYAGLTRRLPIDRLFR